VFSYAVTGYVDFDGFGEFDKIVITPWVMTGRGRGTYDFSITSDVGPT